MRLKKQLSRLETEELLRLVDAILRAATRLVSGVAPWAPRMDYIRPLKVLARSPFLLDHLEGAQFFVAMYAYLFPGYGLRQELENARVESEIGTRWCYEPFDEEGVPIGVELVDGHEAVFTGKTPYQAVVRMVWLLLSHGRSLVVDIDSLRRAEIVEPMALSHEEEG